MSASLQARLASEADEHLRDITASDVPFRGHDSDEPYEEALERIAAEWGDWFDDDYVWSPNDAVEVEPIVREPVVVDEAEEESLEAFVARIDQEWQGWDDD